MARADAYIHLISRATGLPLEEVPSDPVAQLAAVQAAQLLDGRLQRQQHRRAGGKLQRTDRKLVETLIETARTHFGLDSWTAADLAAVVDVSLSCIPSRIGQVLRRANDDAYVHNGHRIECCGSAHGTNEWRLRAVAIHLVRD